MNSKQSKPNKPKIVTLADIANKEPSDPIKVLKKPNNPSDNGLIARRTNNPIKQTSKSVSRPVNTNISGSKPTGVILSKMPRKIGLSLDPSKWRCNICTFLNENTLAVCQVCSSMKGEKKVRGKK